MMPSKLASPKGTPSRRERPRNQAGKISDESVQLPQTIQPPHDLVRFAEVVELDLDLEVAV
jgi:hypothetical protein